MQASRWLKSIAGVLCAAAAVWGDTFEIAGGGMVEGQWLNPSNRRDEPYRVRLPFGGEVTIPRQQVRSVRRDHPRLGDYERMLSASADSVEAHWRLAEWCRRQGLAPQRRFHLRRIIALEPDHLAARRGLGMAWIQGRWQTQASFREERGERLYRGRYMTEQEIRLVEEREAIERAEKGWRQQVRRDRDAIVAGLDADAAWRRLREICDPHAAPALIEMLEVEPRFPLRLACLRGLARIQTGPAIEAVLRWSLDDPNPDVRAEGLELLAELGAPRTVSRLIEILKENHNLRVNRAATALATLEADTAIDPLIDALITEHVAVIGPANPEQITTSFGTGGAQLATGDQRQVLRQTVRNPEVLAALVQLSGGSNFLYNQNAWRHWHASRLRGERVNVRR